MKLVLLAATAATYLAAPAILKSEPLDPIVIQGPVHGGLVQWKESVSQELNRNLSYPRTYPGWDIPEGTVAVRFDCGADGKPTAVAISRSSGDRMLDRAVMRAVARIDTLHPLPAQVRNGASIRANVIFASDQASLARQEAALRKDEARLAERERKEGRQVVVLATSHRTAG